MAKEIKHLKKEQLESLGLYHQFEQGNNFKTKKAKYEEIGSRLKQKPNTVRMWINRWYETYLEYLEEVKKQEKLQKNYSLQGLTKKQTAYIFARISGKSQTEAKLIAGYSSNTEASKIENNPKVLKSMAELSEELLNDMKLGPRAILDDMFDLRRRAQVGVEEVEIQETHSEGKKSHIRKIHKKKYLNIELAVNSKVLDLHALKAKSEIKEKELKQRNKEFLHKKRMDLRSQDREDKRLEMDIERFEVDRQKIMNEEKKSDPKKLIIEVLD